MMRSYKRAGKLQCSASTAVLLALFVLAMAPAQGADKGKSAPAAHPQQAPHQQARPAPQQNHAQPGQRFGQPPQQHQQQAQPQHSGQQSQQNRAQPGQRFGQQGQQGQRFGQQNPQTRTEQPGYRGVPTRQQPGGFNRPGQGGQQAGRFPSAQRPGQAAHFTPPRGAAFTPGARGGGSYSGANGRRWEVGRGGEMTHFSRPGMDARFGAGGHLATARVVRPDRSQMIINRGAHGERMVETVRPDGSRIVSYGPRAGYLQRPFRPGYVQRTYIIGGRPYASVYHVYSYGGMPHYMFVPPVYYHPAFYGWAYRPWRAPIVFSWGWGGMPWFGFYRGYFAPAPYYPGPPLWITDYILAANLQAAYANRPDVGAPPPDPGYATPLSPAVKQAIAEEVRAQLLQQQQNPPGPNPPPQPYPNPNPGPGPDPNPPVSDKKPFWENPSERVFPVAQTFNIEMAGGQTCSLSSGDMILRMGNTVQNGKIGISVMNSMPGDCPAGTAADIEIGQLEEMHNQFLAQTSSGVGALAQNQGKGNVPPSPPPNPQPVPNGQAAPDPNAQMAFQQQQQDANQTEADISRDATSGQANP